MLEQVAIDHILFLDIETVPQAPNYDSLSDRFKKLWDKKAGIIDKNPDHSPSDTYIKAGIYAEFGKIVCISVGFLVKVNNAHELRIKSFYGENEKQLLIEFGKLVSQHFNSNNHYLCAHNGKEFDFPYIARRMLINGIKLPKTLDIAGKKPWEVMHLDTLELWKFGDFKNYTSLELLTTVFDIPTPKDDIDGSMIRIVYWEDKDLERIRTYCQKDVIALTQLYLKYNGLNILKESQIKITNS